MFRAAENEDLVVIGAAKKLFQKLLFLANVYRVQRVRHRLGGRAALTYLDSFRFAHCPITKLLDLRGNGGGEQHRLPCAWAAFDEATHIGQEPHVQHSIRFVQNENFDLAKPQHPALDLIQQPPWRRDDDIRPLTQDLVLPSIPRAAKQNHGAQIGKTRVIADGGLDLSRELSGRFEHERAQRAALPEARNDRQRKRRGLPSAGLSRADKIPAFQDDGYGA